MSGTANIKNNNWDLDDVIIFKRKDGIFEKEILKNIKLIQSIITKK